MSIVPNFYQLYHTVCSGSVVEDIDMAEMASVASDGARKSAATQHHQVGKDDSKLKNVEFASNILNDMGPPALCSALLLAANAACKPNSSNCSLRSFDDGEAQSDAVSDVVAHVDTVRSESFVFDQEPFPFLTKLNPFPIFPCCS
jgi:hypothetical protein